MSSLDAWILRPSRVKKRPLMVVIGKKMRTKWPIQPRNMTIAISSRSLALQVRRKLKSSHNNRPAKNEVSVNIEIRRVEPQMRGQERNSMNVAACIQACCSFLFHQWICGKKYGNIPDHVHAFVAIIQGEVVGNIGPYGETNLEDAMQQHLVWRLKKGFRGCRKYATAAVIDLRQPGLI